MSLLVDLGLPGLVFIGLCVWLIRKVVRAARTESDLEGDRLQGALAEELQAAKLRAGGQRAPLAVVPGAEAASGFGPPPTLPPPTPGEPLAGADLRDANPEHLPLISALVLEREAQLRAQLPGASGRSIDVLWIRSNATHAVWLERRRVANPAARPREVICVALIDRGRVTERWFFG